MTNRTPDPMDVHVGRKVRRFREIADISQSKLAEGLGITFQQVQKYENGSNRVSASRLYNIANILQKPFYSFFPINESLYVETSQKETKLLTAFNKIAFDGDKDMVIKMAKEFAKKGK